VRFPEVPCEPDILRLSSLPEDMATLVEASEARGYRWTHRVVNSLAFLPQRRERAPALAKAATGRRRSDRSGGGSG
jgi:hypothetical protein